MAAGDLVFNGYTLIADLSRPAANGEGVWNMRRRTPNLPNQRPVELDGTLGIGVQQDGNNNTEATSGIYEFGDAGGGRNTFICFTSIANAEAWVAAVESRLGTVGGLAWGATSISGTIWFRDFEPKPIIARGLGNCSYSIDAFFRFVRTR